MCKFFIELLIKVETGFPVAYSVWFIIKLKCLKGSLRAIYMPHNFYYICSGLNGKYPHIGLCIWKLGPRVVVLFGNVMEPLGNEVHHWEWALRAYSLITIPIPSPRFLYADENMIRHSALSSTMAFTEPSLTVWWWMPPFHNHIPYICFLSGYFIMETEKLIIQYSCRQKRSHFFFSCCDGHCVPHQ